MAAFAHGSILFSFLGPLIPAVIWVSNRQKSQYASFQALQATGYQILISWCWILGGLLVSLLLIPASVIPARLAQPAPGHEEFSFILSQVVLFLAFFGLWAVFNLIGVIGGILCLTGRDFRYPWLGNWLWKYLTAGQTSNARIVEDREENWMAGMGHAGAIQLLWGLLLPLIVWLTQKNRSARLRFQSLQALLYQSLAAVLYLVGLLLYIVMVVALFIGLLVAAGLSTNRSSPIEGDGSLFLLIFFIFIAVIMVYWMILILLMPIYHLFAFLAALNVLRGRDYRYPLLGKLLAGRLASGSSQTMEGRQV